MRKEEIAKGFDCEISMGPFGSDIKVDNFQNTGIPSC